MAKVSEAACFAIADDLRRIALKCDAIAGRLELMHEVTIIDLAAIHHCADGIKACDDTMRRVRHAAEIGV